VTDAPLASEPEMLAGAGGSLTDLDQHEAELYRILRGLPALMVAYSGGVDSAYLAWAATAILGSNALSVTADSPSYPEHHRQLALRIARDFGLNHVIVPTGEVERAEYRANPANRCY
jgi:pyridinium-3,5-biscarboxylic acid mononucleotide sulfurtransferase